MYYVYHLTLTWPCGPMEGDVGTNKFFLRSTIWALYGHVRLTHFSYLQHSFRMGVPNQPSTIIKYRPMYYVYHLTLTGPCGPMEGDVGTNKFFPAEYHLGTIWSCQIDPLQLPPT